MNFKKIFTVAIAALLLAGCSQLSKIEAKHLVENFVNDNLLAGGMTAEVLNVEAKSGMWEVNIRLSNGQEVKSLLSKDGKIFVPEAIYIDEVEAEKEQQEADAAAAQEELLATVEKSDKPVVELFVMSYCPFGTQAEKAIIPAVEALGDDVDFRLMFVSYAMHGATEVYENLRQYAISEKYPEKLIPYLKVFLDAGDSAAALAAVELTDDDLAGTTAAADAKFEITKSLEDESSWLSGKYPEFKINDAEGDSYGVRGSPTLVVNGTVVEGAERTPAAMLQTICAAYETAPEACNTELSETTPSSGFGYAEGAGSGGECS